MAKITLENGMVIEGTIEELRQMGAKFPVEAEEQAEKMSEYKRIEFGDVLEGDFVKFKRDKLDITAGKYYEITGFDEDGDPNFVDDANDTMYVLEIVGAEFYRLVAGGEVEALKVGDYVKILSENGVAQEGDIVKIVKDDGSEVPFEIEYLNGEYAGWKINAPDEIVRATDEEVADAKEKLAAAKAQAEAKREEEKQAARWAKIGRKPGEFKKGDIVEITGQYTGRKYCGEIVGEVKSEVFKFNKFGADYNSTEYVKTAKLITPVESRFDRQEDAK